MCVCVCVQTGAFRDSVWRPGPYSCPLKVLDLNKKKKKKCSGGCVCVCVCVCVGGGGVIVCVFIRWLLL